MRMLFDDITALPDNYLNVVLPSSDALVSFPIADVSNCRKENSPKRTKSESSTIATEPNMHDFCSTKISFDTSFIHAGTGGGLSLSLSSSTVATVIVSRCRAFGVRLTSLGTEREVESVSERVEGLVLRFIVRPDFRTVKLGMFQGREQQTRIVDVGVGRFDDLVKKSVMRQ